SSDLAQLRLRREPAFVERVELCAPKVDERLDEEERGGAERLVDVERERGLVADDERRPPFSAPVVDGGAQVAGRKAEHRVDVARGAVRYAELQIVRPPRPRHHLDLEAGLIALV